MTISALTHIGTKRQTQQDAILVNGILLTDGILTLQNQEVATCFVADGVATSSDGAFAAQFILNELKALQFKKDWNANVAELLEINQRLLKLNTENDANSASTLAGVVYDGLALQVFQAGDCEIYLIRGSHFIPLAPVHNESIENIKKNTPASPLNKLIRKLLTQLLVFMDLSYRNCGSTKTGNVD